MIEGVDTDEEGRIDFCCFLSIMTRNIKNSDTEDELIESFKVFDRDGDGFINAYVFFLMCNLKASPSSVPLGKQLVNEVVEETENGDGDLISRSRDEDDALWFGLEEALDRTLSATGLRTVCRKAMQNTGGQFNSNDVVHEVFLRRVNMPAVLL